MSRWTLPLAVFFALGATLTSAASLVATRARPGKPGDIAHCQARTDPWKVVQIVEPPAQSPDEQPAPEIHFAGGMILRPHLYAVAMIATLHSSMSEPFIVLGGSSCNECDASTRAVFISRPSTWPVEQGAGNAGGSLDSSFSPYPHRNFQRDTNTLWDWSRLFVGRCLAADRDVVVSFSAERNRAAYGWTRDVSWAYVVGDRLAVVRSKLNAVNAPSLASVLRATGRGSCHEIRQVTYDEPF